jgi:hypothetical protein
MMRVEATDSSIDPLALAAVADVALAAETEIRVFLPTLADDTVLAVRVGQSVIPETGRSAPQWLPNGSSGLLTITAPKVSKE